jgi:thiol-disulfide isomerase/thioredoxin
MMFFGVNYDLQQFFNNPLNVLLAAIGVYIVWNFYKTYEGFSSGKPVIMLFHLPTCGYCIDMMPEWDKFQDEYQNNPDITVVKVNGANDQNLTKKYGVNSFPTVILVKDDGTEKIYEGARTAEGLKQFITMSV